MRVQGSVLNPDAAVGSFRRRNTVEQLAALEEQPSATHRGGGGAGVAEVAGAEHFEPRTGFHHVAFSGASEVEAAVGGGYGAGSGGGPGHALGVDGLAGGPPDALQHSRRVEAVQVF